MYEETKRSIKGPYCYVQDSCPDAVDSVSVEGNYRTKICNAVGDTKAIGPDVKAIVNMTINAIAKPVVVKKQYDPSTTLEMIDCTWTNETTMAKNYSLGNDTKCLL